MEHFSPWVLVPIIAIIGWVIVTVTSTRARHNGSTRELHTRVEELERRVTSIEKGV